MDKFSSSEFFISTSRYTFLDISIASSIAIDGYVLDATDAPQAPDPLMSQRKITVVALWERLRQVRVIHVRGTPASGKSTLARLLGEFVRATEPGIPVHLFTWPCAFPDGLTTLSPYYHMLNSIIGRPKMLDDWFKMQDTLLIIDEAQESYKYLNLWNDFLKRLPSRGPMVALFSSYGSPCWKPLEDLTPITFHPNQRVSIRRSPQNPDLALFFTRAEFDDVVDRFCKYHGELGQAFILAQDLKNYIWEFTSGHPAGVRTILDGLRTSEVSTG